MRIIKDARGREIITTEGPERPRKEEIISTNNIKEIQEKRKAEAEADAARAKEEVQHAD